MKKMAGGSKQEGLGHDEATSMEEDIWEYYAHARLVAGGYSQVPGVDLSENSLLVVNDVMFKMLLLVMIKFDVSAEIVNTEADFFYGE